MYDFESLIGELLQSRPELTREELMRRIGEKKLTVGAGYLTDQGALFLVAGELGVSLRKEEASSDLAVKDLYIGANDVTVVARVLSVYPEATYNKKDGGKGKYRRVVLFDGPHAVRLTAWEEKSDEIGTVKPETDSLVRISNAYVKQGLDGKPTLNLGKRGRFELVTDQKIASKIPLLSAVTEKVSKFSQERQIAAVESVVTSEGRFSEFTRSDGSPGSLFQFGVAGDGVNGEVRVVVWTPNAQPELKRGQKVVVTNVKAKRSSNGEFEIHGDSGSTIVLGSRTDMVNLRVANISQGQSGKVFLGLDKDRKVKAVEIGSAVKEPRVGEVIVVTPDSEMDGRMFCRTPGSLEVVPGESFPSLEELAVKLKDAKVENSQILVEVIALSNASVDDVKLKDGTVVKKGELVIGDDTDEIKLVAWRDLSERLSGIQPGQRLRLVGAVVKSTRMGARVLQVSSLTAIEKVSGRS